MIKLSAWLYVCTFALLSPQLAFADTINNRVTVINSPASPVPVQIVSPIPLPIVAASVLPVSAPSASPIYVSCVNCPNPLPSVAVSGSVSILGNVPVVIVSPSPYPSPTNYALEAGGNLAGLNSKITASANGIKVDGSAVIQPVSGAFYQATQPVSGALGRSWDLNSGTDSVTVAGSVTILNPGPSPSPTITVVQASPVPVAQGSPAPVASPWPVSIAPNPTLQTYTACYADLPMSTSNETDIVYVTGSATKTVSINRVQISGTETTVAMHLFEFVMRSSADSGGTCIAMITGPHDQSNSGPTATAYGCSVSPSTIGTLSAYVGLSEFVIPATTGVDSSWPQIYTWGGTQPGQSVVLRGTSQLFAINMNSLVVTGGNLNVCIDWTEQ